MQYPRYKLPFDELTTTDERIDFVHNQLVASQLALNQLLKKEGLPPMAEITRQVPLRVTAEPLQGAKIQDASPLTGRITSVAFHYPEGCDALVEVAFGHKDTWVMPGKVDTFIALNDATPVFVVNEPITKGEELWMIVRNGDGGNAHSVSVIPTIRGVE
ncbi:hypothetical protein ES703_117776 [subsurface metagenome]